MRGKSVSVVVACLTTAGAVMGAEPASRPARRSVLERLTPAFLKTFDQERAALARRVKKIDVPYPLVRGTFHMHNHLSHDSTGTIEEIVAAAKATNTKIVGFTNHPDKNVDVIEACVKGWHDGVYFLAGTESNNELFWPGREGRTDLRFACHVEEVATIDPEKYDGMEIYNTHSDVIDEPTGKVILAMVLNLQAVRAHPEGAFCSFLDPPTEFLERFDRLTMAGGFAGVAANDSHQNQGLTLVGLPDGTVEVLGPEGDRVWSGEGVTAIMLMSAFGQKGKPKQRVVLTQVQLDPYEISMRHVGTFLQIDAVNEGSVRRGLRDGRIVLGFEIIAPLPAAGFWVERAGEPVGTVGDRITHGPGLRLRVKLPAAAEIRVVRNGETFAEATGDALDRADIPAGVYRLEAYQQLAGQRYPWVISNPVYVVENPSGK